MGIKDLWSTVKTMVDNISEIAKDVDEKIIQPINEMKNNCEDAEDYGEDEYGTDYTPSAYEADYVSKSSSGDIYLLGTSIVNIDNVFGGITQAALIGKRKNWERHRARIERIEEDLHSNPSLILSPTMEAVKFKKSFSMMKNDGLVGVMDVSYTGDEDNDLLLVLNHIPVEVYNNIYGLKPYKDPLELTSALKISSKCVCHLKKFGSHVASLTERGGYIALSKSKWKLCDVARDEECDPFPSICTFGEYTTLTTYAATIISDQEKLMIGELVKNICQLTYIPDLSSHHTILTDIEAIEDLKKNYAEIFGQSEDTQRTIFKQNLMGIVFRLMKENKSV